jgi:N utilization substance protein B
MLVRALYQWQIADTPAEDLLAQFEADEDFERVDQKHFRSVLAAALADNVTFDSVIAAHATRGTDQLDAVGRAVLLMALAELTHCANVPTKVAINEAVELAKRYGATDSFRFVNAVLDKAARDLRGGQASVAE